MLRRFVDEMTQRRRAQKADAGRNITDPRERAEAHRYLLWNDHGILRTFWTNFGQVAPDVYRSNHPTHQRFQSYKSRGIKAVLNLRGAARRAPYLFEEESCAQLGLTLVSVALQARKPAERTSLLALFEAFDTIPRPFVMHCKSGADRAGLAAALYLLDQGSTVEEAKSQLSLRYLHLRFTKTGVQDHMLDIYAKRLETGYISIRDWIRDEYDPAALALSFAQLRTLPL